MDPNDPSLIREYEIYREQERELDPGVEPVSFEEWRAGLCRIMAVLNRDEGDPRATAMIVMVICGAVIVALVAAVALAVGW